MRIDAHGPVGPQTQARPQLDGPHGQPADAHPLPISERPAPAGVNDTLWRLSTPAEREAIVADQAKQGQHADAASGGSTVPLTATSNAAGKGITGLGTQKLIDNKELRILWENTKSAWDGKSGFSEPLANQLRSGGVSVGDTPRPVPAGSVGRNAGVSQGKASNINGAKASDAIAQEHRAAGYQVEREKPLPKYNRRVDVAVDMPHPSDPRLSKELRIESKVGYTTRGGHTTKEMLSDIRQLADNRAVRRVGFALERAGKIVRPIGLVMDAVQLGSAFKADGKRIGQNTGKAASELAGGAAFGAAGAVIGQALIPIPVVGAAVGAAVGSWAGSKLGDLGFNKLKHLF